MAKLNSREEFTNYCLRALGAPVMRINVDPQQVDDRIEDALDLFWEYHSDGSELVFLSVQVTETMKQQGWLQLPPETQSVLRVINMGSGMNGGGNGIATINLQYQQYITDVMNPRRIMQGDGLSAYYITQSYLGTLTDTFSTEDRIQFNQHYDKLHIMSDWNDLTVGSWMGIECYRRVMPEVSGDVWNNRWLKKYATAQIKKQWGTNLVKFSNVQLPGGVQLNAQEIMDEAKEEIQTLKQELHDMYEEPPNFFVG
ncbi:neck protein [Xanthomonas phage BUDD]|nr:neck protein [Xanthomonas phage BUDD]